MDLTGLPPSSWAYRVDSPDLDALSDALDIAGITCDGLTEQDGVSTAWFSTRPDPSTTPPMPLDGRWEEVPTTDWSESWKEGLDPITVGALTILPPWLAPDGPQLDKPPYRVVIEPGMAFGTGHHETTTAVLRAMQDVELADRRVADIGTGTGVLALAAIALGAREVIAVDVDELAITVATENIAAHGTTDRIDLRVGSCEAVDGTADLVIANIITDKLLAIAGDLVALVAPGGTLLCSGVAVDRSDEARSVFADAGMEPVVTPGREWSVLVARRPVEGR